MHLASLLASIDSLIVASALATVTPRRLVLPMILLFALCDGAGSAAGAIFGLDALPADAGLLASVFLVGWGAAVLLGAPLGLQLCGSPLMAYVLPPLLAIDNIVAAGAEPPVLAGVCSGLMAALGFALGEMLLNRRSVSWAPAPITGIPLLAAGVLLALGG